jgi:hypothetical protein
MLLSHSHRFVFVHVERTGGTSVFHTLKRWADIPGPAGTPIAGRNPHASAWELRAKLGASVFDDYFTFAFVRNPWERELSLFDHARADRDHSHYALFQRMSFDDYLYWLKDHPPASQRSKVSDPDGKVAVKLLGRYERLQQDFVEITACIGIEGLELPRLNVGQRTLRDYHAHYTSETRQLLAELRREDIEAFGYEF